MLLVRIFSLLLLIARGYALRLPIPPTVCIIGGGAAGYMAAINCGKVLREQGQEEAKIVLLEASKEPLSKVRISGGGRCNVIHDPTKGIDFISKSYPRGERALKGPFSSKFGPTEAHEWFSSRGVTLKTEKDGRVFPDTDDSGTIIGCLNKELKKYNISLWTQTKVSAIGNNDEGDSLSVSYSSVGGDKKECILTADRVIVATGSARLGHEILKSLGHTIVEPAPSLFSFVVKGDNKLVELAGASVPNARVKLLLDKQFVNSAEGKTLGLGRPSALKALTTEGPLLVTHQGMSGPAVLRLSSFGARVMAGVKYQFDVEVNWLHGLSLEREQVHSDLMEERSKQAAGKIYNFYPDFLRVSPSIFSKKGTASMAFVDSADGGDEKEGFYLPRRLWHYLLERAGLTNKDQKWTDLSKSQASKLADELCRARYSVRGRGKFKDEFVTAGGVSLKEVNFQSFSSKKITSTPSPSSQGGDTEADKTTPLLYLCGEVLDIDGVTGGFNFQNAWTSGYIAGGAAAASLL